MAAASLPPEGELRLGPVALPAGKHIRAGFENAMPVAWVTHGAVPEAGRIWAALWDAEPHTGLVPFLLGTLPGDPARPWDQEEFGPPAGIGPLEIMNPAAVLEEMWEGMMPSDEEEAEPGAPWAAMRAPFSRYFPGLDPATDVPLTPGELECAGKGLSDIPAITDHLLNHPSGPSGGTNPRRLPGAVPGERRICPTLGFCSRIELPEE